MKAAAQTLCAVLLAASVAACGRGSGAADVGPKDVERLLPAMARYPRTFTLTRKTPDRTLVITGAVQDDYRYRATVTTDGRDTYEEVVVDDGRYLRLLDPSAYAGVAAVDATLRAFLDGRWVYDPKGAPPEFSPSGPPTALSAQFVLGAVRYLEAVPEVLRKTGGHVAYNPDSVTYLPKDDKFPVHPEDGKRFDVIPKAFDPGVTVVSAQDLEPYFLYLSVWVAGNRVARVEKLFDLPDLERDGRFKELREQLAFISSSGGPAPVGQATGLGTARAIRYQESYLVDTKGAVQVDPPPDPLRADLTGLVAVLTGVPVPGAGGSNDAEALPQIPIPTAAP